jgi:hypothetical protein
MKAVDVAKAIPHVETVAPLLCDAIDEHPQWGPRERCTAYAELARLVREAKA